MKIPPPNGVTSDLWVVLTGVYNYSQLYAISYVCERNSTSSKYIGTTRNTTDPIDPIDSIDNKEEVVKEQEGRTKPSTISDISNISDTATATSTSTETTSALKVHRKSYNKLSISLIQGPPGTGKTSTVCVYIYMYGIDMG